MTASLPRFAQENEAFWADLRSVKTLPDWMRFQREWFDTANWPKKTSSQLAQESVRKRGPVTIGGREWSYTNWVYDLPPQSRYDYFWALRMVGAPLKFPDWRASPKTAENGWRQECPFDEISTSEIGEPICPKCGRELILTCYSR